MLREYGTVTRDGVGLKRRWFSDDRLDLYVWLADDDALVGFQLCYDKGEAEKALSWREGEGFIHTGVDDGQAVPGKARSPILVLDGHFDLERVLPMFVAAAEGLEPRIRTWVSRKLEQYRQRGGRV